MSSGAGTAERTSPNIVWILGARYRDAVPYRVTEVYRRLSLKIKKKKERRENESEKIERTVASRQDTVELLDLLLKYIKSV